MQLGTRWPVGGERPPRLPAAVSGAVVAVESELTALGVSTGSWRWTLTWLEGRPIVELDDGTRITYDAHDDTATVRQAETSSADSEEPADD
ncbi:hypothetical protein [Compostimonas suwonensis]|uniref:Uncharacterized protein n=1 Tax=Compostimonas suwonensis TaxID=1048394 RepID=A0A2M9BZG5_9MICO|nr:hypothetical protein [Compostimonas suwonensis]PJJ63469.1 hypothetical protein CLV54_1135 [Compostimonas suwonensis]